MTVAMLVGGVMTAALQVAAPNPFGHDNMFGYLLDQHQTVVSALALVFLLCNLGSICSHCLYFSAVGFSRITKSKMRVCAVALGVIGTVLAAVNIWALFVPWLTLLGIVVPPIGAIMIVDLFLVRKDARPVSAWRPAAFAAWLIGSIVAFAVEFEAPGLSTPVAAFIAAAVAYLLISSLTSASSKTAAPEPIPVAEPVDP
ncbi:hypothetical protein [Nonomuraea lactucae]|uniref:hypothetical protein n=1 Tax=Nonomuraea lactucae TaxID=2249762 RepID=UPI001F06BC67|nr:hypothetical protein [Nonomuraea lactucae]